MFNLFLGISGSLFYLNDVGSLEVGMVTIGNSMFDNQYLISIPSVLLKVTDRVYLFRDIHFSNAIDAFFNLKDVDATENEVKFSITLEDLTF